MKTRAFLIIPSFLLMWIIPAFGQDYDTDYNKALSLYNSGNYAEAAELFSKLLPAVKEKYGENDTTYTNVLSFAATCYTYSSNFEKAEPLWIQVVKIYKQMLGENHPRYANSVSNLATLYLYMDRPGQAEPLMIQGMELHKAILGERSIEYAWDSMSLAVLYQDMGRYEMAEPLMIQAIKITKEIEGENHSDYATMINYLAVLDQIMSRYEQAEPLLLQSIKVHQQTIGENHPLYARDLNNLGVLYYNTGRYEEAEPLYLQALKVYKQIDENHPEYSITINNLANLYADMGRYEEAVPLYYQAMEIKKKQVGENNPSYANKLQNLATVYQDMGRYEQAESLYMQAMEIRKELLGENHPDYARSLYNLANLYKETGRPAQAEPFMIQAMNIDRQSFGEDHILFAKDLNKLAQLYQSMGYDEKAEPIMNDAFIKMKNFLSHNNGYLTENELKQNLGSFLTNLEIYQSFNFQRMNASGADQCLALEIELFRKGVLLKSVMEKRKIIMESNDTSLINSFYELIALRKQTENLLALPQENRYHEADSMQTRVNEIEKTIAFKSKDYERVLQENEIDRTAVRKSLKDHEAAIEFSSFHYYINSQWTDSTLYCAIVIKPGESTCTMKFLFEEKQLIDVIPASDASSKIINTFYQNLTLYDLIWKPLDSLLQGITTVYFAPSGLLNNVSLSTIHCPDGRVLSEHYRMVQLSSTRSLAIPEEPPALTDAVVYGGIRYDTDTTAWLTKAEKYKKEESDFLAYKSASIENTRGGFAYLEGTKKEADLITEKLNKKSIATKTFTGMDALEESFYALSGNNSPTLIHISTHGFYYPDTISDTNRKNKMYQASGDIRFKYAHDPLQRSGLLMAGGNITWKGLPRPEGVEDGILTAMEVSNMNLMNTELVVLSACQTGLGDVKGSEGVEGLQRGFKMAGVRYLIMSLWQVPDKETTEFMENFYNLWPTGDLSIRDAFHETQLKMKSKYPNEPYKWAGFELME